LLLATAGSGPSASRQALAAGAPPPWIARDIGVFQTPGSLAVDPRGIWTLRGSHGDTPLAAEASFFVHQPLSGSGSILALLLGQEGGNREWGTAGLALMEKAAVGARAVQLAMSAGHGLTFTFRSWELASPTTEHGDRRYGPRRFPVWLRLQRDGDQFVPFASADGFGWTQLRAPIRISGFAPDAFAGLAVASGRGAAVTGSFSNPVVTPGLLSPIVHPSVGNGTVLLSWPAVSGATGYLVRRSAPNTPGFAAELRTPAPIRETSFLDTGLPNDAPVRYLVSALADQGGRPVEGWPTAVLATPVGVPAGLLAADIGLESPLLRGSIVFEPTSGLYRISGSGAEVGGSEDHCFFVSRRVSGDFQITVRILEKPANAGLMVRESLDGASRMLFLAATEASGVHLQARRAPGAAAATAGSPVLPGPLFTPPLILRLVRRGDVITPYLSTNGTAFVQSGMPQRFEPPLPATLDVGYAITSQKSGTIAGSSFTDLTIDPP
jgi:hypothetical protein